MGTQITPGCVWVLGIVRLTAPTVFFFSWNTFLVWTHGLHIPHVYLIFSQRIGIPSLISVAISLHSFLIFPANSSCYHLLKLGYLSPQHNEIARLILVTSFLHCSPEITSQQEALLICSFPQGPLTALPMVQFLKIDIFYFCPVF